MKLSQPTNKLPTGVISVHRSALMANKQLAGLTNRDPTWLPKLEMNIGTEETPFAQSLPPPPLVSRLTPSSAASSFNTYDYCWRTKAVAPPTAVCTPHPLTQQLPPINKHNKFIVHKNIFPGGGTHFHYGADMYIALLANSSQNSHPTNIRTPDAAIDSSMEQRASGGATDGREFQRSSFQNENYLSPNRQNWNMEFKDATSATQAAAESAERASFAARAAAELSGFGKQYST